MLIWDSVEIICCICFDHLRVRSVIRPPQGSNASLEASFMSSEGPEGFFEFPRVGSGEFLSEEGVSQDVWGHMLFPRWVGGGVSRSGLALSQIIWHSRWHPARGDGAEVVASPPPDEHFTNTRQDPFRMAPGSADLL